MSVSPSTEVRRPCNRSVGLMVEVHRDAVSVWSVCGSVCRGLTCRQRPYIRETMHSALNL